VRHGYLPERKVMTGIGPVPVTVPRVLDRKPGSEKVMFAPSILPRYLRKAKSVEEVLPWLYLKGLSTGDFSEALAALLGPNAEGLSATTITRLKADWWSEYEAWEKRDFGARRFILIWADGVYFKPRMADPSRLSDRAKRDEELKLGIERVFEKNLRFYGVRKVWHQMRRENFDIARCTVARLMKDLGLEGVVRGKKPKTTIPDIGRIVSTSKGALQSAC
jgi:hypothetical protein